MHQRLQRRFKAIRLNTTVEKLDLRTEGVAATFTGSEGTGTDVFDRVLVGDRENNRIQIFDQNGTYIDEWRQFGRPSGIYITADDRIYVFDSESFGMDNPAIQSAARQ